MIYQAFQRLEKGQDGNDSHYTVGASIEHPDYPAGQAMFDYTRAQVLFFGSKIESDGNGGLKYTEIRHVDMGG